jgi:hypothetical protein
MIHGMYRHTLGGVAVSWFALRGNQMKLTTFAKLNCITRRKNIVIIK